MFTTGTLGRVVTSLRSTPLLSLAAVLCAAIGVAATTATAALFSAVAVRGVPFPAADRLVRIWLVDARGGDQRGSLSIPDLRAISTTGSPRSTPFWAPPAAGPSPSSTPAPSGCAARASRPTTSARSA